MRALSNLLKRGDGRVAEAPCEWRCVKDGEIQEALALILGSGGPPADASRVVDFIEFASHRSIDLHDVWVARRGERMVWAALPLISPGKTMLIIAPPPPPDAAEVGSVLEAVCSLGRARGVHLAQSLLEPADESGRTLFARRGFGEMAELFYLHALVRKQPPAPELPAGFYWRTYSDESHPEFAQTILASYEGSRDCPALNGLRDVEDIIAGHKASGECDPRFWYLLFEGESPRAVLLLSRVPRTEGVELVYLGLVPEARGRGIGDLLVKQALWAVREMNLSLLSLAVDSKNEPALNLYYRHGLQRIGSKIAVMRDLRRDSISV